MVASDGQAGEEITDQDEGIAVETNTILMKFYTHQTLFKTIWKIVSAPMIPNVVLLGEDTSILRIRKMLMRGDIRGGHARDFFAFPPFNNV